MFPCLQVACKFVAILVHYFSLAGLVWILLEAVMLYLKLVAVYGGEFVRIRTFLLFGWGRFYIPFKFKSKSTCVIY
jgi:hypothetical protein